MMSFLEVNGIYIDFTDKEVETLALETADGSYDYNDIYLFLKNKANEL